MAHVSDNSEVNIDDLLDAAEDATDGRVMYANNARFTIGINEVIVDLFFLASNPRDRKGLPTAKHVARFVLPLSIAKDISEKMLNGISWWEERFGVSLPLNPSDISESQTTQDDDDD